MSRRNNQTPLRRRNPVVLAIVRRLVGQRAGRHTQNAQRPSRQDLKLDLDERVRAVGEW